MKGNTLTAIPAIVVSTVDEAGAMIEPLLRDLEAEWDLRRDDGLYAHRRLGLVLCRHRPLQRRGVGVGRTSGDRFAALEPICDAVRDRFGAVAKDIARGISCRHDWGPQYTSGHFQGSLAWLGIEDSPAFVGEPPCNGCAVRFIRTLKEQVIWVKLYDTVDELAAAIKAFVALYNREWLIERHGHRTPHEA
jgi:hypothetical protein